MPYITLGYSTDFLDFFVLLLLHNMRLTILKSCLDEVARANSRIQDTQNISGERLVFERAGFCYCFLGYDFPSNILFSLLFSCHFPMVFVSFIFFLSAPQVSFFSEPDRTDFISLLQLAEFFKEPLGASVSLMISVKLKQCSLLSK